MIESGGGKGRVRACAAQLSGADGKQISSNLRESRRPRLGKRMRVIRPERNKIRLICGSRTVSPASVRAERRSSLVTVARKMRRRDWGGVPITTGKSMGRNISDKGEDESEDEDDDEN